MKRLLGIVFSFALICSASAEQITVTPGSGGGVASAQINAGTGTSTSGTCSGSAINCTINSTGAPYFRVRQSGAQGLSAIGTPTKITFDTVDLNVGSAWSATNHNFQPLVAGTYEICTSIVISGSFVNGNLSTVDVSKNGTGTVQAEYLYSAEGTITVSSSLGGCTLVAMNGSTDTVETDAASNATAPSTNGVANRIYMTGHLVGP